MYHFHGSVAVRGKGILWLDAKQRKAALKAGKNPDSHEYICEVLGLQTDKVCHIEWNPLTKQIRQNRPTALGWAADEDEIRREMLAIDYRKLCKLIVKPIVNPLLDIKFRPRVARSDLRLLLRWVSVKASICVSADNAAWLPVAGRTLNFIRNSIIDSMGPYLRTFVWASTGTYDSTSGFVYVSIMDSITAYAGSFFGLKYKVDIASLNKLWKRGLVPVFDGKIWRLHSGKDAKVVWSGTIEDLKKAC